MNIIETISYITVDEYYPGKSYRSVIVTLETGKNTFKFRIIGIDDYVDIMSVTFRNFVYCWIKKRHILNIIRIVIEEE